MLLLAAAFVALPLKAQSKDAACHYTDKSKTVVDGWTKLEWQKNGTREAKSRKDANERCLSLDGKGWRLPTLQELATLIDESKTQPSIADVFSSDGNTMSERYWSSSIYMAKDTETFFLLLNFAQGTGEPWKADSLPSNGPYVRCVREYSGSP